MKGKRRDYLQLSGAATARSTVMPTMGERCEASRVKIITTCRGQVVLYPWSGGSESGPCGQEPLCMKGKRGDYLQLSSTATATETVIPTMGLLPAPRKPIISTWAGTEEEPAN